MNKNSRYLYGSGYFFVYWKVQRTLLVRVEDRFLVTAALAAVALVALGGALLGAAAEKWLFGFRTGACFTDFYFFLW